MLSLQEIASSFNEIYSYVIGNAWGIIFVLGTLLWFTSSVLNPHLNSHRERQSLLEATKPGRVSVLEVGRRRAREAQQEEMNKKSIEALVERKLKKAEEIRKKRVDPPPIKGRRLGRKDEQSSRSPLMPITAHTSTYRPARRNVGGG